MQIKRTNPISNTFVEQQTQPQAQPVPATSLGIGAIKDAFEKTATVDGNWFTFGAAGHNLAKNFFGGPNIGTMIGEAIGNSANDTENGEEPKIRQDDDD